MRGPDPFYLFVFPIILLCVVGGVTNILSNSGLANGSVNYGTTSFVLTCAPVGTNPSPICSNTAVTGCQATPTACTMSGNTLLNVLNQQSPFTQLLTGDFIGFATSFFNIYNPAQGTLSSTPQYNWATVGGTVGSKYQQGYAYCNTLPSTQTVIPLPISPYIYQCNIHSAILPGYSYWIASATVTSCNNGNAAFLGASSCASGAVNVELNAAPGTVASPTVNNTMYGVNLNGQGVPSVPLFNGAGGYIILGSTLLNTNFNASYTYEFKVFYDGQTQTGAGAPTAIQLLTILGFVVGAILTTIIALNLTLGATVLDGIAGGTFAVGPQGARMAQVIGFGLLIWAPIYSEFGGWLTPNLLPNGIAFVGFFFLTGMIFVGLYGLTIASPPAQKE